MLWRAIERLTAPDSGLASAAALRIWGALWLFRDPETGVAAIDRDRLAELAGVSVERTSRVLTALEKARLIRRRRERIPGMQGPGRVIILVF